ncbi:MAG: arginase [Cyclobacteriaceae bacterium]|nr:arginase [Cyclobacteriaceae bacterium]
MKVIKIIEVLTEFGAGKRGASLGIDALHYAAIEKGSKLFDKYKSEQITIEHNSSFSNPTTPNAKYIDRITEVVETLSKKIKETISENYFPIVIAGDHSTAYGTITGIKASRPEKKLGLIWIDAHADLHTPYTSPSGNVHGMPVAAAAGIDNLEHKRNTILPETKIAWDKLKSTGGINHKIDLSDVVIIGGRSIEPEEESLMQQYGIRNITVEEISLKGAKSIALEALKRLENCDLIHVSFDVDSLDVSISEGTGTPVPGGLSLEEAMTINQTLVNDSKVCCWEIVEINPLLEEGNTMARVNFGILENVIETINKRINDE